MSSNWLEDTPSLSGCGSKRSRPTGKAPAPKKPATLVTMPREQLLQCDREQFDSFVQQATDGRKLTREERSEVSRQRKLIKNRRTAAISRQRKKEHQNQVQESIDILTQDQELHREELTKLEADNAHIKNEIAYMNQLIQQNPIAQSIWKRQEQTRKQWHMASPGVKVLARYLLIVLCVAHLFFLQAPTEMSTPQTFVSSPLASTRADSPVSLPGGEFSGLSPSVGELEPPIDLPPSRYEVDSLASSNYLSEPFLIGKPSEASSPADTPSTYLPSHPASAGCLSHSLNSSYWDNRGPSLLDAFDSASDSTNSPQSSDYWEGSSPSSQCLSDEESSFIQAPVKEEEMEMGYKNAEAPRKEEEPEELDSFQDWLDDISSQSNGTTSFANYSTFEEFYNSLLASMASSLCSPPMSRRDHHNLPY